MKEIELSEETELSTETETETETKPITEESDKLKAILNENERLKAKIKSFEETQKKTKEQLKTVRDELGINSVTKSSLEDIKKEYDKKLNTYITKTAIAELGLKSDTANDKSANIIKKMLLENAKVAEDNEVLTEIDGKTLTLKDAYTYIKDNEDYTFLFTKKPKVKSTGLDTDKIKVSKKDLSKMSEKELIDLYRTNPEMLK